MKRIVIFGATSAIAHEVARLWVARGADIVLVGRNEEKLQSRWRDLRVRAGAAGAERVHMLQADLDRLERHPALLAEARAALGGIDAVLIAHGTLPDQAACVREVSRTLAEIHTNALSVISLCTLVGNLFEQQGHGCLAVISSVAGDRGRQSNYVYGAAKGMVTLFLQGLRNRLAPQGISVLTVKPGFVDTPMTAAFEKKGALWATPQQVGQGIVRAMDRGADVAYLPWFWRGIMAVILAIPEPVFKRLKL